MRANDGVWIGWPGGTESGLEPFEDDGMQPRPDLAERPRRSRASTRGSPTPPCGRSTTTWWPSRSSTASGGTPTSRSTGASPTTPPTGRRRAPPSGCTTTSSSWSRRCCASCGPTCGSASSCTSRSRRPSCSSSCPGAAQILEGLLGADLVGFQLPGGAAELRAAGPPAGRPQDPPRPGLPARRAHRARGGVPDLDRRRRLRGAGPPTRGRRPGRRDPRGARQPAQGASSASTGSTTPRASTPGCARSAS